MDANEAIKRIQTQLQLLDYLSHFGLDMKENERYTGIIREHLATIKAEIATLRAEVERLKAELAVRDRAMEILAGEGWSNGKTVEPFKSERLSKALAQSRAEIAKEAEVKPEAKP